MRIPHSLQGSIVVRLFLALWLAITPTFVWATSLTLTGAGGPAAGGVTFSLTFTDTDGIEGPSNPQTFTAKLIGTANTNRIVAVGVAYRCSVARTDAVTAMTIGGVSATKITGSEASANFISGDLINSVIWYAAVPTGTTADVVITWDNTPLRIGIVVDRIITATATPTNSGGEQINGTVSNAMTVPAGGAGFAMASERSAAGGNTTTWTNATKDSDSETATMLLGYSDAHFTASATVTAALSGSDGVSGDALSWAAWGP